MTSFKYKFIEECVFVGSFRTIRCVQLKYDVDIGLRYVIEILPGEIINAVSYALRCEMWVAI